MDHQTTKQEDDAKAMPPPPPPRPILLEAEVESLKRCLQNAMLKAGKVYAFYGDTRRLGLTKYANHPPKALTSTLGRELEKYDQLCDAIESHLLRAIAVLQRDLQREEKKEEAIRLEKEAQKKSETLKDTQPGGHQFAEPAPPTSVEFLPTNPRNSPTHPSAGSLSIRRPSAISISSLQRPTVPPKLDLSSSSMRMNAEESSGIYASGLASPVSLAPKSARPTGPNEFTDDLMAAFATPVDQSVIDLTLPENDDHRQIRSNIDPTAGSSSEKPIELDLDMEMDMSMNDPFGDNREPSTGVDNMFEMASANKPSKDPDFIDLTTQDIFATLSNSSVATAPNVRGYDSSAPAEAPSPATLLASGFSQHLSAPNTLEGSAGLSASDQPFDMSLTDLEGLSAFNSASDFDMDAFFANSGGGSGESLGKVVSTGEQTPAS
ncbi:hypothetical protein AN958_08475 [Leucoagaricus sp. SymC.cos]|nr:hypothetical protein AN958_08475 [Leucoagaricus sp. SymC.cos]